MTGRFVSSLDDSRELRGLGIGGLSFGGVPPLGQEKKVREGTDLVLDSAQTTCTDELVGLQGFAPLRK